jgi:WD40 repeat protein
VDEGRSVRHRSSVKELIGSINVDGIGLNEINFLLRKFREPGNTFLNPFVRVEVELSNNSVLDITHEALIRNWNKLKQWSEEDAQNLNDYIDFNKQLHRWEENNKSAGFLLSLGPLEQFETWYKNSLINEYWIVKYDESNEEAENKLVRAKAKIAVIENYLLESRTYLNSIEAAKKKRNRIVLVASIAISVVLLGLSIWAISQKNYASKQEQVAMQKMKEAENSKSQAMRSKEEAEKAKLNAQENEKNAMAAKKESEQSANDAMAQKHIAEKATVLAQQKSAYASEQAARANKEMENALLAKDEAKAANQKVLRAEIKSKNVTSKTLSQQLGHLAISNREGDTLSTLFAMHAWDLHKEVNGKGLDPIIYNALYNSIIYMKGSDGYKIANATSEKYIMELLEDNNLVAFGNTPELLALNTEDNKKSTQYHYLLPSAENTFVVKNTNLVFREEKSSVLRLYALNQSSFNLIKQFDSFKGNLKGAVQLNNTEAYLLVDKKGNLYFYSNSSKPDKIMELNEDVISFAPLYKDAFVIGTASGKILLINVRGEKINLNYTNPLSLIPYAIESDADGKILFVGFSDGTIKKYLLKEYTLIQKEEYKLSKAMIKNIFYNPNSSVLAASSNDNKIHIMDFSRDSGKPINFEIKGRVNSLIVDNEGFVIAALSDFSIQKYYSDCGKMYKKLCSLLPKDISLEQWINYFGDEIEFNALDCINNISK